MSRYICCSKKDEKSVLEKWSEIFARDKTAQSAERNLFVLREQKYRGIKTDDSKDYYKSPEGEKVAHQYNIIYENIEAQVDSTIYPCKVTALHPNCEAKAKKIERRINSIIMRAAVKDEVDLSERTVRVQGGAYWHPYWDMTLTTRRTNGDATIKEYHPNNVIPQHGALTVEDMDHIFTEMGISRKDVELTYGVRLKDESEEEPQARSVVGSSVSADDFVTLKTGYFRNEDGGIGKIVWVGETLLYYMEDYETKRLWHCEEYGNTLSLDAFDGDDKDKAEGFFFGIFGKKSSGINAVCPVCGKNRWNLKSVDNEVLSRDVILPGFEPDEMGNYPDRAIIRAGERIPVYKPGMLPFILQKSVSCENELLGISDVDVLEDAQDMVNFASLKMHERVDSSRPYITLPPDLSIEPVNGVNQIRPKDPVYKDMIDVKDIGFDLSPCQLMRAIGYEEGRNLIGITDS